LIAILSVTPEFSNRLSGADVVLPAGGGMGGPAFGGPPGMGGMGPGPGFGGPPGMGGMGPGPGAAIKTVPAAVAAAPAAGESDMGFNVVITGYTPPGMGRALVVDYKKALLTAAPMSGKKPYYLVDSDKEMKYDGADLTPPAGAGAAAVHGPWGGGTHGPFWDVFVPDMIGLKPAAATPAGGPGFMPPGMVPGMIPGGQIDQFSDVDAMFRPLAGATTAPAAASGTPKITGAYMFTMMFKAHVR
jgi:hypothetical protein